MSQWLALNKNLLSSNESLLLEVVLVLHECDLGYILKKWHFAKDGYALIDEVFLTLLNYLKSSPI